MPRRTLQDARQVLDDLELNAQQRRELEDVYDRIRSGLLERESQRLAEIHRNAVTKLDSLYEQQDELEDELRELQKRGAEGLVEPDDYREELERLSEQRRRLARSVKAAAPDIESMAERENNPEGYLNWFFRKYPQVAPNFPW